ncbi:MAG: DUF5615 family PIN-like protein [Bacteroidota bacterium]
MKILLLDENLPAPLKFDFSDRFEVTTVHDRNWQSKKDDELLRAISNEDIDYLLTADRNLEFQQNISKFNLKLVVLFTYDNRYKTLQSKVPLIEQALLSFSETDNILHIDLRNR